jgi:hypothetical protein
MKGFIDAPIDFITKNKFLASDPDNNNHLGLHPNFIRVVREGIAIEPDHYICPGCGVRVVPRGKNPSMLKNLMNGNGVASPRSGIEAQIPSEPHPPTQIGERNNYTIHMNGGRCNLLNFILIRLQIIIMRRLLPYFIHPSGIDQKTSIRLCRLWNTYISTLGRDHTMEHNYKDISWSAFEFHLPIAFSWAGGIEKNIYGIPSPGGKKPRIYNTVELNHSSTTPSLFPPPPVVRMFGLHHHRDTNHLVIGGPIQNELPPDEKVEESNTDGDKSYHDVPGLLGDLEYYDDWMILTDM